MRRFFLSSVVSFLTFGGGVSLVILKLARPEPQQGGKPEASAPPVTQQPVAAAQAGCAKMKDQPLRSTNSGVANVILFIGLGQLSNERDSDVISLRESKITPDIYTPDVLGFPTAPSSNRIELIPDPDRPPRMIGDGTTYAPYRSQPLRQVMVPEALVDIIVLSRWEYELRFYHSENVGRKSGGYYSVAGQPYAVYRFKNPNPPAANRLEIAKIKDGREDRSEYSYDEASDSWQLMRNGQEVTRKFSMVDPNNPCERVETRFDMEDGKLSKTIKIYRGFPWGQELVRKVEDPDGKALTTTYSYFEDPDGPHYSFPKTTTHPDGRVERQSQQPDPTMGLKREP